MKMRKFFCPGWILLLALFFVQAAAAQENRAGVALRHPLWKVEGQSNTVYLLGSVHLLKPDDYPLAAPILSAFTNSPVAVFETDIDGLESVEAQQKILSKTLLPAGQTLEGQLSPAMYAAFSNHVEKAGLPVGMFDHFKPSMAALTLEVVEIQRLGVDPAYGVDQYFFRRARKAGKRIVPLETVDHQIELATDFSREEGEALLKTTLQEIDDTKRSYSEIVSAWQTGDSATLERLLNEARAEAPALFKRLVSDRNRQWTPKIEALLQGAQNAIVIVGAGHLVGQGSVVELLKNKGLKVTQL